MNEKAASARTELPIGLARALYPAVLVWVDVCTGGKKLSSCVCIAWKQGKCRRRQGAIFNDWERQLLMKGT